jgi:signal transduction histidine kinase
MSLLEVIQLIGYSTGAALHLWMCGLLLRGRRGLNRMEKALFALAVAIGCWHACNLVVALHGLLGLGRERWVVPLRLADTLAVVSITLSYSFLLHVHLHLWANAHDRSFKLNERVRVYLSYIPALFLIVAVPRLWTGAYAPMFEKLSDLVLPFALWATYVLGFISVKDILISRKASSQGERLVMQTLAASFIGIGLLILAVYAFRLGEGTSLGLYLKTFANLGSLVPSALIAYYIYRYRYLELIIRESLIVATLAAVALAVYLYGIRSLGGWLTARYSLRAGAVEAILIVALVLVAAPLRGWLERRFHKLFQREATLYRDVVARIGSHAGHYKNLSELLRFIEERATQSLGLRAVRIFARQRGRGESDNVKKMNDEQAMRFITSAESSDEMVDGANGDEKNAWVRHALELIGARDHVELEGEASLRERGFEIAYLLRREEETIGLMLVDAAADALTRDVRAVLEVLAAQVAIAIEDYWLVEENVRLERRLAQGERLAALGQMAATVAHEVKNPLSAIKSIAQVMREDERLSEEYTRDLTLIVGEADRLSRSVTQLLSFARTAPPEVAPTRADELVRAIVELFHAEARGRGLTLEYQVEAPLELKGAWSAAVRDALSNLLINAMQATPAGGRVLVEARVAGAELFIAVTDSGAGVAPELRERIWEPFFTTKQRGAGLGLAIVRKRIEEVQGTTHLVANANHTGARFELHIPLP